MALDAFKGWSSTARHTVTASYLAWSMDAYDFFLLTLGLVALRVWLAPRPLPAWRPRRVVAVGVAAYALVFSFVTVTRHFTFATHALDLGYYVQLGWNLARGAGPYVSLPEMHAWGTWNASEFYSFFQDVNTEDNFWSEDSYTEIVSSSRYKSDVTKTGFDFTGADCQAWMRAMTSRTSSGRARIRRLVVIRTKPSIAAHARPTPSEPARQASHHRRAASCTAESELCA